MTRRSWIWIVSTLVVLVLVAVAALRWRKSPVGRALLASASSQAGRVTEARLAGFPWSPLQRRRGSPEDPSTNAQLKLDGLAASVIESATGNPSIEVHHGSGVAELLIGHRRQAVEELEAVSRHSVDAAVWNDLAVARDAVAADASPLEQPRALAAVDRALDLRPNFPEAVFNRALILEHLGFADEAVEQWKQYLSLDSTTRWAAEANAHLQALQQSIEGDNFAAALSRASREFISGNTTPLAELVRRWPQDARSWGEGPLLARWADAIRRNNLVAARETLDLVRQIAADLAANGDNLLADAVAVINDAHSSSDRRRRLAEAHARYDAARRLGTAEPAAAEAELKRASTLFRREGSPMADVAQFWAAVNAFEQNRVDDSCATLRNLLSRNDPQRHRALRAFEMSQLVRCHAFAGEWTPALQEAIESSETFAALGERANESFALAAVAAAYDHVGATEQAWTLWIASMKGLASFRDRFRRHAVAVNAIRSCIRDHAYDAAGALAQATIESLKEPHDMSLLCDVLVQRARAAAEGGADATVFIAEARRAAAALPDVGLRARAEADLTIAQGIAARRLDPEESIGLLSRAIDFYREKEFGPWLVEALYQRGRSNAAASRIADAMHDFRQAIEGLEAQRSTLTDSTLRERFFDLEPTLAEELSTLQLSQHDLGGALATADRFRARTLRETIGLSASPALLSPASVQQTLPTGTAILEYSFAPSGLTIFCLTHDSLTAASVAVDRGILRRMITDFRTSIEQDENVSQIQALGAELDRLLVEPVRSQLGNVTEVICVAERDLQSVPFAALFDRASGHYMIEERSIRFAPSMSQFREDVPINNPRVVLVGNPAAPGLEALPQAEREANGLARLYPGAVLLTGTEATKQRFVDAMRQASLIHYAGHAQPERRKLAALLLSADSETTGVLDTAEIMRLRLNQTKLVVIAACSSARGETLQIEGVPSLARAFMAAGVPAIVATLWDIDDALTSALFTNFHHGLVSGQTAAAALQQAQVRALHSSDESERHPRVWAGIILIETEQQGGANVHH